jgi:3-isopropylmalate dehydratase small subunit
MRKKIIRGKPHIYGDNIDTDIIIPGKYTKTLDLNTLAEHVLEDLDPHFRNRVEKGDILVAGDNFGCGSSREQAPLALKTAGVSAVVAKSFARIFFRNAINVGLPVLEVPHSHIEAGDELAIDLVEGTLTNVAQGKIFYAVGMPGIMVDILQEGGLVHYLKKHGDYWMG